MTDVKNLSHGDPVLFVEGISGAPKGTKAQFLKAVSKSTAEVKITKRILPSKDRNNDPHYVNGAKITVLMTKLALNDGTSGQKQDMEREEPDWTKEFAPK